MIWLTTSISASVNAKVYVLNNKKGVWLSESDFRYLINVETKYFALQRLCEQKDNQIQLYMSTNEYYEKQFKQYNKLRIQNSIFRIGFEISAIAFVGSLTALIIYTNIQ